MYKIRDVAPMTNKVTREAGWNGIIEFDDGRCFLGNLIHTPDHGNEVMVFSASADGKVTSFMSYYTEWPQDVSKETLRQHLEKFGKQFENLKQEIAKKSETA